MIEEKLANYEATNSSTIQELSKFSLTGLPIGYSIIVALTGLPIGYSVIVAQKSYRIQY